MSPAIPGGVVPRARAKKVDTGEMVVPDRAPQHHQSRGAKLRALFYSECNLLAGSPCQRVPLRNAQGRQLLARIERCSGGYSSRILSPRSDQLHY